MHILTILTQEKQKTNKLKAEFDSDRQTLGCRLITAMHLPAGPSVSDLMILYPTCWFGIHLVCLYCSHLHREISIEVHHWHRKPMASKSFWFFDQSGIYWSLLGRPLPRYIMLSFKVCSCIAMPNMLIDYINLLATF